MAIQVAELVATVRAETRDAEKNIKGFDKRLKSLGGRAQKVGGLMTAGLTGPILGAGAAVVGLASKAGEAADRVLDLSGMTGLSTDTIQEFQHAAAVAGTDGEAFAKTATKLAERMPQIASGSGEAAEGVAAIGLSFEDLEGMTPDQQMDTIISRLAGMEDVQRRNAVANQIFGGSWEELAPILDLGAEGIAQARSEAHDMGAVMDEDALQGANNFRVAMDELKGALSGAVNQIGAELAPVLTEELVPIVREQVIPMLVTGAEKVGDLVEWFSNLDPRLQKGILLFGGLLAAAGPIIFALGTLISIVGTVVGAIAPLIGIIGGAGGLIPILGLLLNPIGLVVAAIAGLALAWRTNLFDIQGKTRRVIETLTGFFRDLKEGASRRIDELIGFITGLPGRMSEAGRNLIRSFVEGIGSVQIPVPTFSIEFVPSGVPGVDRPSLNIGAETRSLRDLVPFLAQGGIVTEPTLAVVGEAGPEAVIPLGAGGIGPAVNVFIEGSVVTEREISKVIREQFLLTQSRNVTTGIE